MPHARFAFRLAARAFRGGRSGRSRAARASAYRLATRRNLADDIQSAANELQDEFHDAAIEEAIDTMESMLGNEGQESIFYQGLAGFIEWAQPGAGRPAREPLEGYLLAYIRPDMYDATDEIWATGEGIVHEAPENASSYTEIEEGAESY